MHLENLFRVAESSGKQGREGELGPDGRGGEGESTKKCGLLKAVGSHQRF